ncbi:MAG: hypothetical protein QG670_2853 [Thermoproteota archaeon]|nr:hypothetical protein [Thermoproteota archaeon]
MPRRNDLENRALQIVMGKGSEGILQSDLWRELKANSRDGSRISLKLEVKNLIKREKEMSNGRWTYRLFVKRHPLEIDSVLDIPCVTCPDIPKCEAGGEVSPALCENLTHWLLSLTDTEKSPKVA